jgi:HK97 family phage portal protein
MGHTSIGRRLAEAARAEADAGPEARSVAGSDTWIVSPTLSGVYVNEDTVTTIGAYYAGVAVLAGDVSSIPFQVVKRQSDGSSAIDESNPIHELVSCDPDPDEPEMSAMSWTSSKMWHLNTQGNAYSRIWRDGYHRPTGLELLDPTKVDVKRSKSGKLYYDVLSDKVLPADMLHVAAIGYDGIVGRSPIRQARETLGLTMAVEKFGASYFGNGINEGGMIEIADTLDEVETKAFRAGINRTHQGPYQAHKFLLLQGGAKFTPTSITNDDAQFLATRKFQLSEICRILRLSPTKLQDYDRASFTNLEETNQDHYGSSLKPWLKRFQAEFNRKLFTREERRIWRVEHDVSEMLKGRAADQAAVDKIYLDEGVLNRDEIRARHGWGKIKGGSTYLVPMNMAPLDKVAEASIETLKGVKPIAPGPSAAVPADSVDAPVLDADGATVAGLRSAVQAAAGEVLIETARRLSRRESNALRKVARKADLTGMIEGLDEFYRDEVAFLADAYRTSLALYASIDGECVPTADAFASDIVCRSRNDLLTAIEGPDTAKALAALADRWDAEKPAQILALATMKADPKP